MKGVERFSEIKETHLTIIFLSTVSVMQSVTVLIALTQELFFEIRIVLMQTIYFSGKGEPCDNTKASRRFCLWSIPNLSVCIFLDRFYRFFWKLEQPSLILRNPENVLHDASTEGFNEVIFNYWEHCFSISLPNLSWPTLFLFFSPNNNCATSFSSE